jgi:hypothetical protein
MNDVDSVVVPMGESSNAALLRLSQGVSGRRTGLGSQGDWESEIHLLRMQEETNRIQEAQGVLPWGEHHSKRRLDGEGTPASGDPKPRSLHRSALVVPHHASTVQALPLQPGSSAHQWELVTQTASEEGKETETEKDTEKESTTRSQAPLEIPAMVNVNENESECESERVRHPSDYSSSPSAEKGLMSPVVNMGTPKDLRHQPKGRSHTAHPQTLISPSSPSSPSAAKVEVLQLRRGIGLGSPPKVLSTLPAPAPTSLGGDKDKEANADPYVSGLVQVGNSMFLPTRGTGLVRQAVLRPNYYG